MEMNRGGLVLWIPLIATAVVGTIVLVTFFVFPRGEEIKITNDNFVVTPEYDEIARQTIEDELLALENQLELALKIGGIHPDTYREIEKRLQDFEARGADPSRLLVIRDILKRLVIGGSSNIQQNSQPKLVAVNIPQAPTQTEVAKIIPPPPQENEPVPLPEVLCKSNPNPVFTNHITDITKFSQIKPPPNKDTTGNLKTHSYIETHGARVPVYAPVDMTLIGGAYYIGGPYSLDFRVSCEARLRLGHISEPLEEIKSILPDTPAPQNDSRGQEIKREIFFRAGDLIAYTVGTNPGAGNWDFGVYNSTVKNRYADDAKHNWSDINMTAVCPFQYFAPDLKDAYKQKLDFSGYGSLDPDGESFCAGI